MKNLFQFAHRTRTALGREERSRGFTLLLAALIASIVLAIGTSIFQLAQKSLLLSSVGRDSQFAFYAADTGAECALYWDVRFSYFGLTEPSGVTPACDLQTLNAIGRTGSYTQTMTFQFAPNGYCVNVSVEKSLDSQTNAVRTVIHADGFSTVCASVDTSPRTLQRSVELHY